MNRGRRAVEKGVQRCRESSEPDVAHHHAEQDLILDAVVRRNANRRRLTDRRMLERDRLDLRRSDRLAAPADRLAEAPVEGQQAVLSRATAGRPSGTSRPAGGSVRPARGAGVPLEDDVRRERPDPELADLAL